MATTTGDVATDGQAQDWRAPVLERFTPEIAATTRVTVVADPDHVLDDELALDTLRRHGFDVLAYADPVEFRFAYETRHREVWRQGGSTSVVVVLHDEPARFNRLPFDVLAAARGDGRVLTFGLADLFPGLAPGVVAEIGGADRDRLAQALATHRPAPLGDGATRDFVLRHVFGVTPELIREPAELLQVLLRRHYHGRAWPRTVDTRFIQTLRHDERWNDWPLEAIVPDRAAFLAFLQERWPRFLLRATRPSGQVADPAAPFGWRYPGAADLPFDAPGVREFVDNLFTEGLLAPSDAVPREAIPAPWMAVGVAGASPEGDARRYRKLLAAVEADLPDPGASHLAWAATAQRWAETVALRWRLPAGALGAAESAAFETLQDRIEREFADWMLQHYASLASRSHWPRPVMTHHIAPYLAQLAGRSAGRRPMPKQALLVVDGLALDQWLVLRADLAARLPVHIDDGAVFAWVPTITAVARQALFAGRAPLYFAGTIDGNQKEEAAWQRFWLDAGAPPEEIGYACQKIEPDDSFLQRVRYLAEHPKRRILGLVIGTVDRSLHGAVLGTGGLHATLRHWAAGGAFRDLVRLLIENDYEVFVTADHGNVQCTGIGAASAGTVPDERGSRALVFRDEAVRRQAHSRLADTIAWPPIGLPDGYLPLLAAGRGTFVPAGSTTVAHGAIALEEVVVPFVRIAALP